MPLFLPAVPDTTPPADDPGGVLPPVVPAIHEPEVFKISWTSPAGRVTSFSGRGQSFYDYITTPGVGGFDMPIYTPYSDTSPGSDGELNRGFRTEARDVSISLLMFAYDRQVYRQMRTDLFTDLNPRGGVPGLLTVTEMDGSTRSLECFYAGGLEGNLDDSAEGQYWALTSVEFRAPDPYWKGEEISSGPVSGEERPWFPLFPLNPGGSHALGATTITNHGQVDAQPVFMIKGPATSIHLINDTTGESIDITYTLDGDDVVVVDTTEDNRSVLLNGTTNLVPYLNLTTPAHTLWALKPGINQVNLSILGLGAGTTVNFTYQERFLAAW